MGHHSSTQVKLDGGLVGPLPNKEGNGVGGCRNRFSRPPSHLAHLQQHSNGKKEEQDSEFLPFPLTGLANGGCKAIRPWCWYCEREFEDEKGAPCSYSSDSFSGELIVSFGF